MSLALQKLFDEKAQRAQKELVTQHLPVDMRKKITVFPFFLCTSGYLETTRKKCSKRRL